MARVLVVDDDEEIRHTLRLLLEDADHEVLESPTGADALERLRQPGTLVVLLDLLMPRIDGVEVLRQVAEDQDLLARHAYIVVTADSRTLLTAAQPLVEAVGAAVIQKPFDVDTLLAAVDRAAEAHG
jgi:CheY-like chemotaxis protein